MKNNQERSYILVRIVCAILAVSLWIVVMFDRNPKIEKSFTDIQVSVLNEDKLEDAGYVLMDDIYDYTLDVVVSGFSANVASISKKDIQASINLSGYTEGSSKVPLRMELPDGIELVTSNPTNIDCNIEKIIGVDMKVSNAYMGKQKNGYYVYGSYSEPDVVKIEGARSLVNSIAKAVVNVDISEADENFDKELPVRLYNASNEEILGLKITPTFIKQNIIVYKTKTVPVIFEQVGQVADGYKLMGITSELENIKIAAPAEILDSIENIYLENVDISDISETTTFKQNIMNDGSFEILTNVNSVDVTANVDVVIDKSFILSPTDVDFINLPEDYEVTINEGFDMIKINVTGPKIYLDKLTLDDLNVYVDLEGYDLGEFEVSVEVDEIEGIDKVNLATNSFFINIKEK